MHRALFKLILGVAVALGLTLTAAPVASATPSSALSERAAPSCTLQENVAKGAQKAHADAQAKVVKLKKKIKKLKKKIKKAHKANAVKLEKKLKKKLKAKRKKIRQARLFRAQAATIATSTSSAYAACQRGEISPIVPPRGDNLLDYVGDLLDSIGLPNLLGTLGLEAVIDLLDRAGLLDLLGLGDLRN